MEGTDWRSELWNLRSIWICCVDFEDVIMEVKNCLASEMLLNESETCGDGGGFV